MPASDEMVPLTGSERPPLEGATASGPVAADERVEVTVILRPDPARAGDVPDVEAEGLRPVAERRHLSPDELARLRGAAPADMEAVAGFARAHSLEVTESDAGRRRMVLAGPAAAVGDAFGVTLERFEHQSGAYRGHAGPVAVPSGVADAVVAVLGLDDRPQADFRLRPAARGGTSYTPVQVAEAYGYPKGLDGTGVTIAFVELGGGYVAADLQQYFSGLGLRTPPVDAVPVDGGANSPTGDPSGPDGEVMLDLEVAGAVANGARLAVYFAPNTDQGFVDAVSAAVHDTTRRPAVISISWGGPEDSYSASARTAFEQVLTDAALAGITVCAAAGDNGSGDGASDGAPHVDYPAASPQVLGCGGTTLQLSGGRITSETVWNDQPSGGATGGGVSRVFALPAWQQKAGVPVNAGSGGGPGRGVPDVAGNADPATGYQVRVDGSDTVVGGTSAVAPLWSALVALATQQAGRSPGFLNPLLYQDYGGATGAFNDITEGSNGAYRAGPGWDACTGLGTPRAATLLAELTGPAGGPNPPAGG